VLFQACAVPTIPKIRMMTAIHFMLVIYDCPRQTG
jgi:hypothetical protein